MDYNSYQSAWWPQGRITRVYSSSYDLWPKQGRIIKKKEARDWEKALLETSQELEAPVGKIFWFDVLSGNERPD